MTLESKENYPRHTKIVQNSLGFMPEVKPLHKPRGDLVLCALHARESVADLSRNCKGFRARESVHARVTESRAQGTGVGRDIRQSPSRVRSVFLGGTPV